MNTSSFPCCNPKCRKHIDKIVCPHCGDENLATVEQLAAARRAAAKLIHRNIGTPEAIRKSVSALRHNLGRRLVDKDRGIIVAKHPKGFEPFAKVINGDALRETKRLADEAFDLCLTSVPYFNICEYHCPNDIGAITNINTWVAKLVAVFREVKRTLKPDGVCCIEIGDTYGKDGSRNLSTERLSIALADDDWLMRQEIIIKKTNPPPSKNSMNRPQISHLKVLVMSKRRSNFYNKLADSHDSVWEIYGRDGLKGTGIHRCPMQKETARRSILAFSPEGGTVFDPFCGTGQVLVRAVELRRHAVGIDAKKEYVVTAKKRLSHVA
jgi:site-specific DNA-methyltransferase (cytosine-N4-specific)